MPKSLLPAAVLVSTIALIPATTATMAAVDVSTYRELDQFMNVLHTVQADYVDKVDDKTLIQGAINGMLESLDPHSNFLDKRDYNNLKTQTEGEYPGLGLTVQMEDGVVKVVTPTEDTPAYRAGLKSGDFITHLDGVLIVGQSLDDAVEKMRGTPGTKIKLTVIRPGRDKPFDVTLTREVIQLKAVKWEVRGLVGIININSFSKPTATGVKDAITAIDKQLGGRTLGYVVDLRSNPGGLLDQAIDVSDIFLTHGEIVSQRGREKTDIDRYYATRKSADFVHGLPIVVLVDAGTASAAEIVAGALQDQRRGLVIGERSFGKGSVQTLVPLSEDTALRLTTARYYTPAGRSVQEGGIMPDIVVPQLTDPDYKGRPRVREKDLTRHLINQAKVDDSLLFDDEKPDPRFTQTAPVLEKAGVKDFQLDYAIKTIARLAPSAPQTKTAAAR